jgi:hypothetical protein
VVCGRHDQNANPGWQFCFSVKSLNSPKRERKCL